MTPSDSCFVIKFQIALHLDLTFVDCRWRGDGCPFEIPRPDVTYPVRFYGKVEEAHENGQKVSRLVRGQAESLL